MLRNKAFNYDVVLVSYYIHNILDSDYFFDNFDAQEICDFCLEKAMEFNKSAYDMPYYSLWDCVMNFLNAKGLK